MVVNVSGRAPGAIARWIALFDQAERLHASLEAYWEDPVASRRVGQAIASLFLFEHTMTPLERRQARERLWRRDKSEPLPDATRRQEWEHCRCRSCQLERRLARSRSAAETRPHPAPVAPAPTTPTIQGEIPTC